MQGFLPDTDCIVATIARWHDHHAAAVAELNHRLDSGETMLLAAPTLVEAYSVLTRLPPAVRQSGPEAWRLLDEGFVRRAARVVALDAASYADLLSRLAERGIVGGRVYDAVIAACAERATVSTLVTFNVPHFRPLLPPTIEVVTPRAS